MGPKSKKIRKKTSTAKEREVQKKGPGVIWKDLCKWAQRKEIRRRRTADSRFGDRKQQLTEVGGKKKVYRHRPGEGVGTFQVG